MIAYESNMHNIKVLLSYVVLTYKSYFNLSALPLVITNILTKIRVSIGQQICRPMGFLNKLSSLIE
jgi:hypothetical protein